MGIISRFKDIMSANINALLDKCEDPAKMIDEYMRQVTEQLAEVKKETAEVMAEEKRTKRLVDANQEQIDKYDGLARKALTAGNEDDAKVFLVKKQEFMNREAELQKSYSVALENANKMREMHDKLTKDVQTLEERRKNVKSKIAVAKTQEKLNKVAGTMELTSDSMKAFEKMEAKADNMLDRANSEAELSEVPEDPSVDLEAKYTSSTASVEEELEKLKKEMGM
jgi:phage shock protein A